MSDNKNIKNNQIINEAIKSHQKGNIKQAIKYYQFCIDQSIVDIRVYANYSIILKNNGQLEKSELLIRQAIKIQPKLAVLHYNLAIVLKDLCKLKNAQLSYEKAIELKKDFTDAHLNLGNILKDLGKLEEAEKSTRKAVALKPDYPEAYLNLGNILSIMGKLKEAEISTRKALELKSDYADAYLQLGNILKDQGQANEANKYYQISYKKNPDEISLYIDSILNFSPIMTNNTQIDIERERYKKNINNINKNKKFYLKNNRVFNTNIFYLAYHNRLDDKEILEDLSSSISKIKGLALNGFTKPNNQQSNLKKEMIKVGICSEYLSFNHTVGKLYIKVLCDLLKTDLEITIYLPPGINKFNDLDMVKGYFKRVIQLPQSPYLARNIILNDNLDVLFYPDIGMSTYTYILALSRLALVQVNSLGHANTSGIKNIDYFITSDIEPYTSDQFYTERLIRFSRLPFNYSIPKVNEEDIRTKNLIDSNKNFNIGITQSLFKFHPDYDAVLESILNKIENSYLILIKDKCNSITNELINRWRNRSKILLEKSIFLDRMDNSDFINITRSCHIMLDPFYFGSGNTFYESMAYGIPFVSYPFNQKSKVVSAGYKQMQVKNAPVAKSCSDYVNWCEVYAENNLLLKQTKKDFIQKARKYLFNDEDIYKQYYKFFKEAVKKAKEGEFLENNWKPSI